MLLGTFFLTILS